MNFSALLSIIPQNTICYQNSQNYSGTRNSLIPNTKAESREAIMTVT